MAPEDGKQNTYLREQLFQEGPRFSFVQAIRLLRHLIRKETEAGIDDHNLQNRIRVRPDLSLAFPNADIVAIEETSKHPSRFLITATFLGLYGTSSPLPTFYTEDLLREQAQDQSISRDFIDILNARLYALYFQSWVRHRLFFKIVEEPDISSLERLYCMLGIGGRRLREQVEDPYGMLRYLGLFMQFPRSAEGLRILLSDGLDETGIKINQCVERTVTIPEAQRFTLGVSGNSLGETACLGSEIDDRMGKFRICIGPLNREDFDRFQPDKPAFHKIKTLIRFYLDQPLDWDVETTIMLHETATAQLGEPKWARLGWNTWLFSAGRFPENNTVLFRGQKSH